MGGKFLFKTVLVFCVSGLSLWGNPGTESEESADLEPQDGMALLKSATRSFLFLWRVFLCSDVESISYMASSYGYEVTDDPELAFFMKNVRCDDFSNCLSKIKVAFKESIEEIDVLLDLTQAVRDEPQEETNQSQAHIREAYQAFLDAAGRVEEQRLARSQSRRESEAERFRLVLSQLSQLSQPSE